jgi:uncharacterized protein (TIGR02145 family)
MNPIARFAIVGCAVLFSQCKTTAPTAPSTETPSVAQAVRLLDTAQQKFLEFADSTHGDPMRALEKTVDFMLSLPGVAYAYSIDSTSLRIILKSGLQTHFYFNITDSAGHSLYRGGRTGTAKRDPTRLANPSQSRNTITGKKVLFFAADTKTLPAVEPGLQKALGRIDTSGLDLEVTVLRNEQCTYGVVETFKDYGLVLIDTHGYPDGFMVGSTLSISNVTAGSEEAIKTAVNTQLSAGTYDKIATGKLMIGSSISADPEIPNWQKSVIPTTDRTLTFTSAYLNMLPPMPNTVVMGNMCYSGWINASITIPAKYVVWQDNTIHKVDERTIVVDAIARAFMNRNLISYYGYARNEPPGSSRPVPDEFAAECETSLLKGLITDNDSTGIAHRSSVNNIEFFDPEIPNRRMGNLYFRHFGADDYSYSTCVDTFTDARDGQRYKAVCIGGQNWMAENLNYDAPGSVCYQASSANCSTYGRLYDWSTVMQGAGSSSTVPSYVRGVCPKGWHVPSNQEWVTLVDNLGGVTKAGGALKALSLWTSPNGGATNSSGFSALPGGTYSAATGFEALGTNGAWWSSTISSGTQAINLFLTYSAARAAYGTWETSTKVSCRCLKD